jgi:hypothetical protein
MVLARGAANIAHQLIGWLALSRIYAAPISRLGCLAIECQGVFPYQC